MGTRLPPSQSALPTLWSSHWPSSQFRGWLEALGQGCSVLWGLFSNMYVRPPCPSNRRSPQIKYPAPPLKKRNINMEPGQALTTF